MFHARIVSIISNPCVRYRFTIQVNVVYSIITGGIDWNRYHPPISQVNFPVLLYNDKLLMPTLNRTSSNFSIPPLVFEVRGCAVIATEIKHLKYKCSNFTWNYIFNLNRYQLIMIFKLIFSRLNHKRCFKNVHGDCE